jgi:hypothetical protein
MQGFKGSTLNTDGHITYKSAYLPSVQVLSVNHTAKEYSRERADIFGQTGQHSCDTVGNDRTPYEKEFGTRYDE